MRTTFLGATAVTACLLSLAVCPGVDALTTATPSARWAPVLKHPAQALLVTRAKASEVTSTRLAVNVLHDMRGLSHAG